MGIGLEFLVRFEGYPPKRGQVSVKTGLTPYALEVSLGKLSRLRRIVVSTWFWLTQPSPNGADLHTENIDLQ